MSRDYPFFFSKGPNVFIDIAPFRSRMHSETPLWPSSQRRYCNRLPTIFLSHLQHHFLSCRHIYFWIGTQHLEKLATSSHETLVLLKLLERDLQNQIVCYSCRKFHKIRDAKKYTVNGQPLLRPVEPDCLSNDREAMITVFIHDNFSTIVSMMAMKHYHHFGYDAQSRQLLTLLSQNSSSVSWGNLVRRQKANCQIKNGHLFTRKCTVFHGRCTDVEPYFTSFGMCPHLEFKTRGGPASFCITTWDPLPPEEMWSTALHRENSANIKKSSWNICSEIQQCRYWRTEYKADSKNNDGCTFKVTITIWKDLGQEPGAGEWKAHFLPENHRSLPQPIQVWGREIVSVFQGSGAELGRR